MKSKTVAAQMENMTEIMELVDQFLEASTCAETIRDQIRIAVEEIFTNIVSYAYPDPEGGMVEVSCGLTEESGGTILRICFRDWGMPYDPLKRPDPDFHIPFDERRIGGLGIYMVKKFMDQTEYQFEDGCNQLFLTKKL